MPRPRSIVAWLATSVVVALAAPRVARADDDGGAGTVPSGGHPVATTPAGDDWTRARTWTLATSGFLVGFAAHESGHVVTNLAFGNVPHIEGFLVAGFIPFFAVRPRINCVGDVCTKNDGSPFPAGRRGKFAIVSAGFNVQHITDEILLDDEPNLRDAHGPFRKGVLAFNTLTSVMYALASWARIEDPRGDIANAAEMSGISHNVIAAFVLAPALLDLYRYFHPDSCWAPFAAGTSKVAFVGLTFVF